MTNVDPSYVYTEFQGARRRQEIAMTDTPTALETNRAIARTALEQVCPTGNMALAAECYSEDFADHVGTVTFRGLEGVRHSTHLYRMLLC